MTGPCDSAPVARRNILIPGGNPGDSIIIDANGNPVAGFPAANIDDIFMGGDAQFDFSLAGADPAHPDAIFFKNGTLSGASSATWYRGTISWSGNELDQIVWDKSLNGGATYTTLCAAGFGYSGTDLVLTLGGGAGMAIVALIKALSLAASLVGTITVSDEITGGGSGPTINIGHGPSGAVTPGTYGGGVYVPEITVNANGHISAIVGLDYSLVFAPVEIFDWSGISIHTVSTDQSPAGTITLDWDLKHTQVVYIDAPLDTLVFTTPVTSGTAADIQPLTLILQMQPGGSIDDSLWSNTAAGSGIQYDGLGSGTGPVYHVSLPTFLDSTGGSQMAILFTFTGSFLRQSFSILSPAFVNNAIIDVQTSAGSYTFYDGCDLLVLNGAGSWTVTMPPRPYHRQIIALSAAVAVTLTVNANSGQVMGTTMSAAAAAAGAAFRFQWDAVNATWWRA